MTTEQDLIDSIEDFLEKCPVSKDKILYKYKEDDFLEAIKSYIDSTYNQHYAMTDEEGNNIQLNDIFIADGTGMAFFRNNAIKYLSRFGKKDGANTKDLLKAMHYTILMMYVHNKSKK